MLPPVTWAWAGKPVKREAAMVAVSSMMSNVNVFGIKCVFLNLFYS
jgi:hypothetical protein